ncbi:MAG: isocitrate lyase/phosphoenolpyruvate mutase family protein [Chlamydiales bacterium]|nr:isocitrate lyase/phosphoenolpyruvate mutase family protein [Chlamydiales bacterium]MBY0462561.1 isocitrate lyase/phosphoenolpyruvate mutase family protein [Alphaproteobacteria bacterium]
MSFEKNPKAKIFSELHYQKKPFILANAWDAASARIFEKAGFSAIGTTSAGIAASRGYRDIQNIPFPEMLDNIEQILSSVTLPVSVDIEAGYSNNIEEIIYNIKKVVSLGAVGINFEDGTGDEASPITPITIQAERIQAIREQLSSDTLWINARVDVFYLGLMEKEKALEETIKRSLAYLEAGANSIFVVVNDKDLISSLVREIKAPINLVANSQLPSIEELKELGVSRVSLGSGPMRATLGLLEEISQELLQFGTYRSLTKNAVSYSGLQELFIQKRKITCQN